MLQRQRVPVSSDLTAEGPLRRKVRNPGRISLTRGPSSPRGWEPGTSVVPPVGPHPHHRKLKNPGHVASNQRTHITKGLAGRQEEPHNRRPMAKKGEESSSRNTLAGGRDHRGYGIQVAVNSHQSVPQHESVSKPAVGTSEQKAHISMGMATWQRCPGTTGCTSGNVGNPAVRA